MPNKVFMTFLVKAINFFLLDLFPRRAKMLRKVKRTLRNSKLKELEISITAGGVNKNDADSSFQILFENEMSKLIIFTRNEG
jgi:hypothetical protein